MKNILALVSVNYNESFQITTEDFDLKCEPVFETVFERKRNKLYGAGKFQFSGELGITGVLKTDISEEELQEKLITELNNYITQNGPKRGKRKKNPIGIAIKAYEIRTPQSNVIELRRTA